VLAMRSLVFKAALYRQMREKDWNRIVNDYMQHAIFKVLPWGREQSFNPLCPQPKNNNNPLRCLGTKFLPPDTMIN
jgi:hypothetical protein